MFRRMKRYKVWYGYGGLILAIKSRLLPYSSLTKVKPPSIVYSLFIRTKTSDIENYHQVFIRHVCHNFRQAKICYLS